MPEARVAIGHGQMEGEELEKVMTDFINQQYDVLVSTTIVESGLDIVNANTMVINATDAPQVKVFASGGNEVQADVKKSGDVISINLNALPRGTYIISTGKASVKVMKK